MKFLIITGLSGAGKSSVLKHLEDTGYLCIDNLPALMLESAIALCDKVEETRRFALCIDTRSGPLFDPGAVIRLLENREDVSILFLEAETEALIDRYKETRRDHPLAHRSATLEQAIALERETLQPLRERASYILTSTGLRVSELNARLDEMIERDKEAQPFRVEIMSFGYKRGIPRESDLVFDVRFLPNPFYIREIRAYTGLDEPVRNYVLSCDETKGFLSKLCDLTDYLIPLYRKEGKHRLMIAVGCTGGAHRSVAISEALGAHMRETGQAVNVRHRDIAIEEASWPFRQEKKD